MPRLGQKHTLESRMKMSMVLKGRKRSDESRMRISMAKKGKGLGENNPNFGNKYSEEARKKISDKAKGRKISIETKLLLSNKMKGTRLGKENPAWKGGICKDPYCPDFTQGLKSYIKYRDDNKCQNPNCKGTSLRLCAHHIDYNKNNCDTQNLITICASCNSSANTNRERWTIFYTDIMKDKGNEDRIQRHKQPKA